jgi:hypothetical protein
MFKGFGKRSFGFVIIVALTFFSVGFLPLPNHPDKEYKIISGNNFVQAKNYYLLTLLSELPDVKSIVTADAVLSAMAKEKSDSLGTALKNCGKDGWCYVNRMKFTEKEIKTTEERLAALYKPGNALDKLIKEHLVPSGAYILFQDLPAKEMLVKAWEQDARGINFAIDVYASGQKPNYPKIDSISFDVRDKRDSTAFALGYVSLLYNTTNLVFTQHQNSVSFYEPSMSFALRFLEMNEREQAADFEPMQAGENKAAIEKIKTINWSKFPYSVILIPGAGPEDPKVALSAENMLRCRLAAIQYQKGVAPFIVTSGGKVHPYKTKFCEAIEMKNYLVDKLGIPASAIIIEPHARHTTTNMRNAARLMYRYGIPFTKPGITCTTRGQSNMIGTTLPDRCMKELNEIPFKNGARLSETELEFFPLIAALHINPTEPMDP